MPGLTASGGARLLSCVSALPLWVQSQEGNCFFRVQGVFGVIVDLHDRKNHRQSERTDRRTSGWRCRGDRAWAVCANSEAILTSVQVNFFLSSAKNRLSAYEKVKESQRLTS